MWGEPVSFVAGKLHGWEGLDGQVAKMSKSHFTGQAGVKRVATPSGVDRLRARWLKMGEGVLYCTLCGVEDLEQQSRLTNNLSIDHVARTRRSSDTATSAAKE